MSGLYFYPKVNYANKNSIREQIGHIESEIREIRNAKSPEEMFLEISDLQHSIETLMRIAESMGMNITECRAMVIAKNSDRGYYNEK